MAYMISLSVFLFTFMNTGILVLLSNANLIYCAYICAMPSGCMEGRTDPAVHPSLLTCFSLAHILNNSNNPLAFCAVFSSSMFWLYVCLACAPIKEKLDKLSARSL